MNISDETKYEAYCFVINWFFFLTNLIIPTEA